MICPINFGGKITYNFEATLHHQKITFMKRLFLLNALLLCSGLFIYLYGVEIGIGQLPPSPRIGEESVTTMSSSALSTKLSKKSVYTTTSSVYYPVSANVDQVALTVTFTESVGIANVLVYDANNQLVDMVTVDTSNVYEAVLATNTWTTGSYKLVITYGVTTLGGSFNF